MLCISGSGHLEAAAQVIKKTHTHTAAILGTQNQQETDGEDSGRKVSLTNTNDK